jgi:hypothetical protein
MQEKVYVPKFSTLQLGGTRIGNPHQPDNVVGIQVERNEAGYATRAFRSDRVVFNFPEDLAAFFKEADPRIFFVEDRDLEPILKYLGKDLCTKLLEGCRVQYEGVQVVYHGSLYTREVGRRTLRKIYRLRPFYWAGTLPDEMDCFSMQTFGERIVKLLVSLDMPLRLNSCGSLLGELYSRSVPAEAVEMAYNCYHGGWIEMFKLGHFDEAYDYDLNAAYPTEASKLLDLSGIWVHSSSWVQAAEYGFCYARIYVDIELPFSPLMFRRKSELQGNTPYRAVLNPVGVWEGWITKDEIAFLVSNDLGEVEIADGWWYIPADYCVFPFQAMLSTLGKLKQEGKTKGDAVAANLVKLMAASLQGRFMQSNMVWGKWRTGPAFNPIYASVITSRVRCKVAELALQSPDSTVGVVIDGLLSTCKLDVPQQWKLEYKGECVVANHGDYWIQGRHTKRNLLHDLTQYRWSTEYPLREERYCSLAEAIRVDGFEEAGREVPEVWQKVSRVGKRVWKKHPIVCNDLLTKVYESSPPFPSGVMLVD